MSLSVFYNDPPSEVLSSRQVNPNEIIENVMSKKNILWTYSYKQDLFPNVITNFLLNAETYGNLDFSALLF